MASPTPPPDWAPGWDHVRFDEFLAALRAHLGGAVEVTPKGVRADGRPFALRSLASLCLHMPREQWARAIEGHFGRARRLEDEVRALEGKPAFAKEKAGLRLRVFPERFAETPEGKSACTNPVAPGLIAALVRDQNRGELVTQAEADGWGAPTPVLFEIARRNHERRKPRRESENSFEVSILMGQDAYVASEMLFLDHYVPDEPPAGTLLVVPTQQWLIYHPVKGPGVMDALQTLIVIAHKLYETGPASIVPILYWWKRSKFSMLPLEVDGENVRFAPPVEFVAALEAIGVKLGG